MGTTQSSFYVIVYKLTPPHYVFLFSSSLNNNMGNQPSHFDYSPPTTYSYNHPSTAAGLSPYSRHAGHHWIPASHPNGMSRQHGWYQSSSYYSPAASYSNVQPHPMNTVHGGAAGGAAQYPYYNNQYMTHAGYHHHPVRYVWLFASRQTNVINAIVFRYYNAGPLQPLYHGFR